MPPSIIFPLEILSVIFFPGKVQRCRLLSSNQKTDWTVLYLSMSYYNTVAFSWILSCLLFLYLCFYCIYSSWMIIIIVIILWKHWVKLIVLHLFVVVDYYYYSMKRLGKIHCWMLHRNYKYLDLLHLHLHLHLHWFSKLCTMLGFS